jgi:hypothetical protein
LIEHDLPARAESEFRIRSCRCRELLRRHDAMIPARFDRQAMLATASAIAGKIQLVRYAGTANRGFEGISL